MALIGSEFGQEAVRWVQGEFSRRSGRFFPRDRVDVRNRVLGGKAGNTSILSAVRIGSINRGMHLTLNIKTKWY